MNVAEDTMSLAIAAEWERLIALSDVGPCGLGHLRDRLFERDVVLSPPGLVSANGSCHMLRAEDGWIALNLARAEDHTALPALLEANVDEADLENVARLVGARTTDNLRERARMLQLPLAVLGEAGPVDPQLLHVRTTEPRKISGLRVLDMSALWAGPLCAGILAALGAQVTKIEDRGRPDTLQSSSPLLDERLNGSKTRLAVDLVEELPHLMGDADIMVTSARPCALARLGLDPVSLFERHPALLWIAITAHGWTGENGQRVGFGDDCAVAGGLVTRVSDTPRFFGDAIADPLAGLVGARATLEVVAHGRAGLLDCGLAPTAARFAREMTA